VTRFDNGLRDHVIEAATATGKSYMMVLLSKLLHERYGCTHSLVLAPSLAIRGQIGSGLLGTFGAAGLDARQRFFSTDRRQARQPFPDVPVTITTYQEVICQAALETIRMWKKENGLRLALFCDEIHHTAQYSSAAWTRYINLLKDEADYFVPMSGTFFRGDGLPLGVIDLHPDGSPITHFKYPYKFAVRDGIVREVSVRNLNAHVTFLDPVTGQKSVRSLDEVSGRDMGVARKEVLDPEGESIRALIQEVHRDMLAVRRKFGRAGCLWVARPGGQGECLSDEEQEMENRSVHALARAVHSGTGEEVETITYKDRDVVGKLERYRRGDRLYVAAVNIFAEGVDVKRLRAAVLCRHIQSEMLYRQIVGRILRVDADEDGTAAQVYQFMFPDMVKFGQRLYDECREGIDLRRCPACAHWPCVCPCPRCGRKPCHCPCPQCGQRPCECVCPRCGRKKKECVCLPEGVPVALGAQPFLDGGFMGPVDVEEYYVRNGTKIRDTVPGFSHSNNVQLGAALKAYDGMRQGGTQGGTPLPAPVDPIARREELRQKILRMVKKIVFARYGYPAPEGAYAEVYRTVVEARFGEAYAVIVRNWSWERLSEVLAWVEEAYQKEVRRGR
jgi:superfamily II DNA or RNA helicase